MQLGKQFEQVFKENWIKSFPYGFITRINDQMSGYKNTSRNICDFICFNNGLLFLIECKTIKGNTFPLSNLTQYSKLVKKVGIKGVRAGVIIWFYEHENKILYIPISTFTKIKEEGLKSFNVKMIGNEAYPSVVIPSVKKKVFYDSDYSVLLNTPEGF